MIPGSELSMVAWTNSPRVVELSDRQMVDAGTPTLLVHGHYLTTTSLATVSPVNSYIRSVFCEVFVKTSAHPCELDWQIIYYFIQHGNYIGLDRLLLRVFDD